MAYVLESSRSFLYANPELELSGDRVDRFKKLIQQRVSGQPIAYLTGSCEFWSLPLRVNPAVLIPRRETELLVEAALQKIPPTAHWRIADLGTGSGAIALALASERNHCEIHATDISVAAIEVARENARRLGLSRIRFYCGSWNQPLEGQFQMIVSNPPYIDADDPHIQMGDLRFEPAEALTPGTDGLNALRKISRTSQAMLVDDGWLMLEHGWQQGQQSRTILHENGFINIETLRDLQGHERVTMAQKPQGFNVASGSGAHPDPCRQR